MISLSGSVWSLYLGPQQHLFITLPYGGIPAHGSAASSCWKSKSQFGAEEFGLLWCYLIASPILPLNECSHSCWVNTMKSCQWLTIYPQKYPQKYVCWIGDPNITAGWHGSWPSQWTPHGFWRNADSSSSRPALRSLRHWWKYGDIMGEQWWKFLVSPHPIYPISIRPDLGPNHVAEIAVESGLEWWGERQLEKRTKEN